MKDFFQERRPHRGLSYDDYLAAWRSEIDRAPSGERSTEERKRHHYVRYNYERSEQVHARSEPSAELRAAMDAIEAPQLWMVLTENWCGDSAFCLPVLADAARLSEQVTLRILRRDDHLDIMDQYRTDGSRSIPKLVAFSEAGAERFQWGPRPRGAQRCFARAAERSDRKEDVVKALLAHYEEGGWQAVDSELADAVREGVPQKQARP